MKYNVIYHTDAENDIRRIKKRYRSKNETGLDKKFAQAVKEVLAYIIENPLLFEVRYKNIRIAFTKVFPYGIHYTFDENTQTIAIQTILHTSQNI